MTDMYMRNDNLKRTGQLRNVRVESGFVTVCNVGRYPRIGGGALPSFSERLPASRREGAGGETLCRRPLDAEKKSARGGFSLK